MLWDACDADPQSLREGLVPRSSLGRWSSRKEEQGDEKQQEEELSQESMKDRNMAQVPGTRSVALEIQNISGCTQQPFTRLHRHLTEADGHALVVSPWSLGGRGQGTGEMVTVSSGCICI